MDCKRNVIDVNGKEGNMTHKQEMTFTRLLWFNYNDTQTVLKHT